MEVSEICSGAGSLAEFYEWMDESTKGDRLVYHVGDLMFDRNSDHFPNASPDQKRDIEALNSLAIRVLAHVREGKVRAFQRRVKENVSEYLVEKR